MTAFIILSAVTLAFVAQVVELPQWVLFSASVILIGLFIVHGRDRTNVRNY
jgi:uncharacterized membrane protein YdbT with pleckstrin-like domain